MSRADERLEELRPFIARARAAGCLSVREIAAHLNSIGLCTSRGRAWGGSQVLRAIRRLNEYDRLAAAGPAALSADDLRGHIGRARAAGYTSLREIAAYLNACGVRTSRGLEWHATGVNRMLQRLHAGG